MAIGRAFFFEYLDSRIKSPEELKRHLGLPFLGMVPALFDKAIGYPLINNGVPPNFSRAPRRANQPAVIVNRGGSRSVS